MEKPTLLHKLVWTVYGHLESKYSYICEQPSRFKCSNIYQDKNGNYVLNVYDNLENREESLIIPQDILEIDTFQPLLNDIQLINYLRRFPNKNNIKNEEKIKKKESTLIEKIKRSRR